MCNASGGITDRIVAVAAALHPPVGRNAVAPARVVRSVGAMRWSVLAILAFVIAGCQRREPSPQGDDATIPFATLPPPASTDAVGPVRTIDVPVPGDLPAVVVRGARERRRTMLFVPGMCVHPGGYVMSFQHAAAARGDLVSVQGDVSCGGDGAMRRWSYDLEGMNRRIDAAFAAAGLGEPRDVIVIGYSQGAERAEKLVARWPAKYSRAVLIASPLTPSPRLLRRARGVALLAGTLDGSRGSMRGAVEPLRRVGVLAEYFPIVGARHGEMGATPEDTMRRALDFVEGAERPSEQEAATDGG